MNSDRPPMSTIPGLHRRSHGRHRLPRLRFELGSLRIHVWRARGDEEQVEPVVGEFPGNDFVEVAAITAGGVIVKLDVAILERHVGLAIGAAAVVGAQLDRRSAVGERPRVRAQRVGVRRIPGSDEIFRRHLDLPGPIGRQPIGHCGRCRRDCSVTSWAGSVSAGALVDGTSDGDGGLAPHAASVRTSTAARRTRVTAGRSTVSSSGCDVT